MNRNDVKEQLISLLFPGRCPVCRDILPPGAELCPECEGAFSYITESYCKKCGKRLAPGRNGGLCGDCGQRIRLFESCRCLMDYDEVASELMIQIKYHCGKEYTRFLGRDAAKRLGDWILGTGAEAVVPVPIHKSRRRMRGFNQAEEIAIELAAELGLPVLANALIRDKKTKAQKSLGAGERMQNLREAVAPGEELPKGKTVLLVDDIYTTGATLEACTETLLRGGAGRVFGLCICAGADTDPEAGA